MSQEQLVISSVTGVDVELHIAGPGSRSYAFVVDWHIRFLLAVAWVIVAMIIAAGGFSLPNIDSRNRIVMMAIGLPPFLIYFLYQPIAELITRGRSPGKRIAGVRLVSRDGDVPSVGALLIRNLFRLIDSLPVFYVVGLACTMLTKQHVRIGDLAAGTLLVIDHDREGKSLARLQMIGSNPNIEPQTADLIDEVLERWQSLHKSKRRELAITLLLRVNPHANRDELNSLNEQQLHARLKTSLEGPAA